MKHLYYIIPTTVLLLIGAVVIKSQTNTDVITPLNQAQTAITNALAAAQAQNAVITTQQSQITTLKSQLAAATTVPPPPVITTSVPGSYGVVNYFQFFQSPWDSTTGTTDANLKTFVTTHINGAVVWSPYFDNKLSWFPNAFPYLDSYAIYPGSSVVAQHPDWIAKDTNGNRLYIPWNCVGGTCPQLAGDITNAAFRAYQVSQVQALVAVGYKSLYIDDVDMTLNTGNGNGTIVPQKDPKTGLAMTQANWEVYFASYMQQIRSAFPNIKIMHNSVWFAGSPATDPQIAAQMGAADIIDYERGFGDPGLTGGLGANSLGQYMLHMDNVHALKKSVNIMDYSIANESFSLACYFLIQEPGDMIGFADGVPGAAPNYNSGFDPKGLLGVNLGAPKQFHFWNSQGVWERDYTGANGSGAVVYVNEAGQPLKTITVPTGFHQVGGAAVSQITLGPSQGIILVSN